MREPEVCDICGLLLGALCSCKLGLLRRPIGQRCALLETHDKPLESHEHKCEWFVSSKIALQPKRIDKFASKLCVLDLSLNKAIWDMRYQSSSNSATMNHRSALFVLFLVVAKAHAQQILFLFPRASCPPSPAPVPSEDTIIEECPHITSSPSSSNPCDGYCTPTHVLRTNSGYNCFGRGMSPNDDSNPSTSIACCGYCSFLPTSILRTNFDSSCFGRNGYRRMSTPNTPSSSEHCGRTDTHLALEFSAAANSYDSAHSTTSG
jgi:hypothetical protein